MQISKLHDWNLTIEQAKSIQKNLRAWVVLEDQFTTVKTVARIKTQAIAGEPLVKAQVTLFSYPDLKAVEKVSASLEPDFEGANGLSSFRTAQVVVDALSKLTKVPDLILCDGEGLIDGESFGLASHVGILSQKPTIGLKKPSKDLSLVQSIENERGAWLPLTSTDGSIVVGSIVRVNKHYPPIQASAGHGISQESVVNYVLECFPKEINKASKEEVAVDISEARKKASG